MNKDLLLRFASLAEMFMPMIIFLVVLFIGFIVKKIIFSRLSHWAKKTSTQLDDIVAIAKEVMRCPLEWSKLFQNPNRWEVENYKQYERYHEKQTRRLLQQFRACWFLLRRYSLRCW